METYSIGIDIGTTSTKAVIFEDNGKIVQQAAIEYPLLTPEPKIAEQNPEDIWKAVILATKKVIKEANLNKNQIKLLSFSAAMHSLIVLDQNGHLLTKSITWADQRSEPYARYLNETNGLSIYKNTGTPIHSMSPLSKIIWLKEEKIEIFNKASIFIGIKEYIFYKLFKEYVVDYSIASATGLFNIHTLDWDEEALQTAKISKQQLPRLVPTTEIFRNMNKDFANEVGIDPMTPVVIGANDGCLANLGVNAIKPGDVAMTIGTSGAIRTVVDKPTTDSEGRLFCYALTENLWIIGGPVNNGGIILNWLKNELCREETTEALINGMNPFDLITTKANTIKPGAGGLLFYPYLTGERAPLWNANAKGSFYGLALHHKKEHMMRAVLEGITLNIYMVYVTLEKIIGSSNKFYASGGFAHSKVWRQIAADIFNSDIHVSETIESSALGAVILGRYAIGETPSLEVDASFIKTKDSSLPLPAHVEIYHELVPLYIRIGKLFETGYDEVTAFQEKYK